MKKPKKVEDLDFPIYVGFYPPKKITFKAVVPPNVKIRMVSK